MVKHQGRLLALDTNAAMLLVDGPPGAGCPVISANAGAGMALLVVESTVSGVHDLERMLITTERFGVPAMIVVSMRLFYPAEWRGWLPADQRG